MSRNDSPIGRQVPKRARARANARAARARGDIGAASAAGSQHGGETLLSRRKFLYGAVGVGAVAAVGAGIAAVNASRGDDAPSASVTGGGGDIAALEVPESALVTLNDFEALESASNRVELVGAYDLTYGTLIWVNDDSYAACLLPTEKGSPLAQIGLLNLTSGNLVRIRSKAVGSKERFEIYDVRATEHGLIWTEANVLGGTWRIYASQLSGGSAGEAQLLEEGDATYETPMLAVVGNHAFWQVQPKAPNDAGLTSRLMGATFGSGEARCVFESARRMATPPYSGDGVVVISPRIDRSSVFYQLTAINAESGDVVDRMTMPQSMKPLEAGYGPTGFMFSLPDIYDSESAIANLGTYTPRSMPADGAYSAAQWFGFARTPSAAPAWCDDLLIVKSSYSVCGVDLAAGNYFAIDVDDGTDNYGDYLATSGKHPTFVTYSNIDHQPVGEKAIHACRVKIWAPHELTLTPSEDEMVDNDGDGIPDEGTTTDTETGDGVETVEAVEVQTVQA